MTDASGRETAAFHIPAEADLQACTCGNGLSGTGFGDGLSGTGFRERRGGQTFGSATQETALPDLFRPQKRDFAEFRNIFTFAMK